MAIKFEPFKTGMCFVYKLLMPGQIRHVMKIIGVIYWPGDATATYLTCWADDLSDSSHVIPHEVEHELLVDMYKPCPAFEVLYNEKE